MEIALDVLVAAQEQDSRLGKLITKSQNKKNKELKIAVWPDEPYAEVDDEIANLIKAADDLKHAGAQVETANYP